MAFINPFILTNALGIPRLEATGVTVNTSNVVFSFKNHRFLNYPYVGLILFKLPSYTAPSSAVPVVFDTNGNSLALTTLNGAAVTSAELSSAGVYLAFYDGNTLLLLTGI